MTSGVSILKTTGMFPKIPKQVCSPRSMENRSCGTPACPWLPVTADLPNVFQACTVKASTTDVPMSGFESTGGLSMPGSCAACPKAGPVTCHPTGKQRSEAAGSDGSF